MNTKRKAAALAALAFSALAAGCAAALVFGRFEVPLVLAGYVGYLAFGRKALILWRVDEAAFDHSYRPRTGTRGGRAARLVAATLFLSALALPLSAQQTVFNVPSDSVLDPGKVYLEADELFRPTEPKFSSTTIRGVVGLFPRVEGGVNFGGLNSPGGVVPTANVALKIQPVRAGDFTLTAGGQGLFYLDSADGNPAGLGYGFASYKISTLGTRIEVGGWYSSAGYALPKSTGGALATIEQPIPFVPGLTLAADWWSGENAIGYVTPGFYYSFGGHWTVYGAYSIKNGDSQGNAGLIELGYAF